MRPIWKGAITFGMVTIPIKLYSATEDKDVRFHLLHRKDLAPIEQKRYCSEENVEVPWDDVVRGVQSADGSWIAVDPEEIEDVAPESAHTIEIGDFVELSDVDPIYFEKSYYLEPAEIGVKPFALLRRALDETGRIAVARVALRTKERLATVRTYEDTLVLETMFWPDEIRSTADLETPEGGKATPSSREMQMARSLVESLSGRFDPSQYQDRYRAALEELIARKMKGEQRNVRRRKPEPKVVDLMAALEASVKAAREAKKGGEPPRVGAARARQTVETASKGEAESKAKRAARTTARGRDKENRPAAGRRRSAA